MSERSINKKESIQIEINKNRKSFLNNDNKEKITKYDKIIECDINFSYKLYFEFYFYNSMFFFFLGPLFSVILFLIMKNWSLAINLKFWGLKNCTFYTNCFKYILIVTSWVLYYHYRPSVIYPIELLSLLVHLLLALSVLSTNCATMNKEKVKYIKSHILTSSEYFSEFSAGLCIKQSEIDIIKELQSAIMRTDTDIGLFGFKFTYPLAEKYASILKEKKNNQRIIEINDFEESILEKDKFIFSADNRSKNQIKAFNFEKTSSDQINRLNSLNSRKNKGIKTKIRVKNMKKKKKKKTWGGAERDSTEIKEINFHLQTTKVGKRCEYLNNFLSEYDDTYSGFNIAKLLISKQNETFLTKDSLTLISFILSIINSIIPMIFRYYEKNTFFGNTALEMYMIITIWLGNIFFFQFSSLHLINSIYEYDNYYFYLSQLSNLISSKKIEFCYTKKFLSTIDFFEAFPLKSWGTLHKLLRNYGKKKKLRIDFQLSSFIIFAIGLLVCLIGSVFNVFGLYSQVSISLMMYQSMFVFIILLNIFRKGVLVNNLYEIHITLLKKIKNILSDLHKLDHIFFRNDKYVSENEIYRYGIAKLKSLADSSLLINGEDYIYNELVIRDKKGTKIRSLIKNIMKINDDIIEELRYNLQYEPFKILAIPATNQFMRNIGFLLASALVTISKKLLLN